MGTYAFICPQKVADFIKMPKVLGVTGVGDLNKTNFKLCLLTLGGGGGGGGRGNDQSLVIKILHQRDPVESDDGSGSCSILVPLLLNVVDS